MRKRICFFILCIFTVFNITVHSEPVTSNDIDAKAYVLMEQSSGRVLSEMNPDEKLPIASVTKIMTMLIIMESVDAGIIKLDDMVTVSDNAMSYGGSTMFLESGEQLSVSDMLKGIAVASANDGCVAMAEHLSGSEQAFVDKMNVRAKELGMNNTNFVNTNGLDEENHYSSARDVAIMSRELLKHDKITEYTSIWMDELRGGKFQLANTNKLIRFYNGANGLKTGSTSEALCCLSASAKRNDMQLIAVVLGSPTSEKRFSSAKALLDYGFANYKIEKLVDNNEKICDVNVINGVVDSVSAVAESEKCRLSEKNNTDKTQRRVFINEDIIAPINAGDVIGSVEFCVNEKVIETVPLLADASIAKKTVGDIFKELITYFM